mmetsp:Transcript_57544/g.151474  ORF Transcript_57544/g.151474 Transcript_57544/m.151474 type:complete len:82 (+) Transcript_57544:90-335(+)
MVRLNVVVSDTDKNPQMQEPHIQGSIRKLGHVRTKWGALPEGQGAHWLPADGSAASSAGAVQDKPSKPRFNFFDPAKAQAM